MIVYDSCPACGQKNIVAVLSAEDYTVSHQQFEIWECKNCTLRFTQNVPAQNEIGPFYQSENYISHSDTSKGFVNVLYHRVRSHTLNRKRKLVQEFTARQKGDILDIGCGIGAFLHSMHECGWETTGLEPDAMAREKAKELYGLQVGNSAKLFELPATTFDAITMWHVLEHVHELHQYLEQLKKILKPDGKLFVAVPNYTSYDAGIYKQFWAAYDVPRHLYHFSPQAMKTLLTSHAMKVEETKPMWYDSFYVSLLSEKYKTGKANLVKGFVNGNISNLKATGNTEKCSSLIYIVSHKVT